MPEVSLILSSLLPPALALGVGVLVGRLWSTRLASEPPRPNPWEVRSCREWDGGEHWTQGAAPRPGPRIG